MNRDAFYPTSVSPDYFVWLSELCGAGSPLPKKVYLAFDGDLRAAYEAGELEYYAKGFSEEEADLLADKNFERANSIVDHCAENRVGLLCYDSEYYPGRLFDIETPPPIIYYRGRIERLGDGAFITAVGSRKCSETAYDSAYTMSYKLAAAGVTVVTGMAEGIDTACAVGALDSGGFAVGVLGSGINILYPFENSALFARMFKAGLIITEFSPYTEPKGVNFPIRNRVMAALGDAAFVVEARSGSGALITADYAMQMGRRVYVMPGNVSDPKCRGSNELIRDGATPVIDPSDVLRELEYLYPAAVSVRRTPAERLAARDGYISKRRRRKAFEAQNESERKKSPTPDAARSETEFVAQTAREPEKKILREADISMLNDTEKTVYLELGKESASSDAVGRALGIPQDEVLAALTMLEIYGLVEYLPGGMYSII